MKRPLHRASAIIGVFALACRGPQPISGPSQPSISARPLEGPATTAAQGVPAPRDDGRLPPGVTPTVYKLELSVNPAELHFSGRVRIGLRIAEATRAVVLHARRLRIRTATVSSAAGVETATIAARNARHSKSEADELVLTTARIVPAGQAEVTIDYAADFSQGLNGLYRIEKEGRFFAFTQFEPVGARLAFPCFDEPSAKVPFEVAVTVPKSDTALSNMPVSKTTAEGQSVRIEFEKSPPLPTYLVALAVGPLEIREGKGASVPLRLASVPGRSSLGQLALETAAEHLRVLEDYFGTKYPYPKLDLAAVPDFAAGAMENAGLVTFREERLLVDASAPTALRRSLYGVIAHELAHMWFGDLVTMRWWDDIWLNEGFATWMASRVLDTWRPELHSGVEQLSWTAHALHEDTLDSARAVRQPVRSTTEALEAFDGITYAKGAALLGMVERWLSPRVFRQGVLDYLEAHRFGNASSGDLFDALGRASGKDVPSVLRVFTEQTGVPLVSVGACKVVAGVPTVHVSQQEYRPLGSAPSAVPKLWQFPVCVHSSGRKSSTESEQSCAILTGREADVPLPGKECPAWIQSNADQAGYYHSMLPAEMVSKLASKSLLPERERVGLLSDAWALVESGELDVPAFMRIAERFRGDPEPAVWEQITSALIRISDELVSESDARAFAEVVRRLLKPEADHLTWDAHPPRDTERDQLRRRLVLSTLGIAGRDEAVLTAARGLADRWLTDPSSIDGDRASIALPLAARGGNAALFDRVVARLRGDGAPADRVIAVSALGAFSSPELVRRGLELVLDGTVRMQDQGYLYSGYFGRSETRRAAFDVVAEHVDAYLARIPSFARRGIAGRIAQACSVPDIERARSLLAQRIASLEGADRGFAQALEEDGRCVAFAANQRPVVAKWLAQRRPREPLRP